MELVDADNEAHERRGASKAVQALSGQLTAVGWPPFSPQEHKVENTQLAKTHHSQHLQALTGEPLDDQRRVDALLWEVDSSAQKEEVQWAAQ
jgi:hypothetical protein